MTHPTHGLDHNALEAASLAETIKLAVLSCGHTITAEEIVLRRSDKWPGNALNQLHQRILAALSQNPGTSNTSGEPGKWHDIEYLMNVIDAAIEDGFDPDEDGPLLDEIRAEVKAGKHRLSALEPRASDRKAGIYIASKTKHAARWRSLRDSGVSINSTWIDEAGEGESQDLQDLWRRCLSEASSASAIIVYREPDDVLKGGWIELGAAASHGVPVFAVGIEQFTIARHKGIQHFDNFDDALAAAIRKLSEVSHEH